MSKSPSFSSRTRWIALIVLTGINLLNYIDRFIFSALLPAIKADLKFTDTELGILGSAFLFAYVFASPLFGWLGDRSGRSRIMSVGVGVWSVATAFSGVFTSFIGQFLTRATVGFGESAYSVIAPSTIADYFAKKSRGRVFAIYSGAIPVGSALGYVIGGWLEPRLGWRHSFFVVGVPGLILAAILFFLHDPERGSSEESLADLEHLPRHTVPEIYQGLLKNGGFMLTVLGYAAYTFVVGGMAFWMPSYLVRYFSVTLEAANVQFGALTVVGGFIGTLLGGTIADRIERRSGNGFLKVSVLSAALSVPLFFLALSLREYSSFMAALFILEVALFLCISPLDAAVISYVRPAWRSTAMALNVFLIHVLGDGISRTLMGMVSDATELRDAIGILPWALMIAGVLWLIGFVAFFQPLPWPQRGLKLPRWQAHRGFRPEGLTVVENTLEAFRQAKAAGAVMSECDVRLTSDDEAVVFHDDDLKRLTGLPESVSELTAADMSKYAQAPTLLQLLTDPLAPEMINIELKSKAAWRGEGLEEAVVKVVREAKAEERVIVSSFNPFALRRIAKLAPEIPRALLATDENDPSNRLYLKKMWLGFWARPHMLNLDHEMIAPARIERWADRGLGVAAWTVNDPARARALIKMGVRGVISDRIFTDELAGMR